MVSQFPHNLPPEFQLKKVLDTEIGKLYFYGYIVVFEVNEGVMLSYKTGFSILIKSLSILRAQPWVYISNRVNSYSVNPIDYKYFNKVPTLKAMGIVNYNEVGHQNANLEAKFCEKPFKIFNELPEAINWGKDFLIK